MSKRPYINNSNFLTETRSLKRNFDLIAFANPVIFPVDWGKFQSTIFDTHLDHVLCGHFDIRFRLPFPMLRNHPFPRDISHSNYFFGPEK